MIINSLNLTNFKSHSNTKMDFNLGLSIIIGENGAGKSTILEAISYALFKQFNGKKINDLIKINQKKMVVELIFKSNSNEYKVIREKTPKSSKATLYINSDDSSSSSDNSQSTANPNTNYSILCEGDKNVSDEIQNILNMDSDLFLNAIYVRQGEIADLVNKTPAEKKKLIGKLLGIESLEKAWENSLPLIKDYETKKAELKGKISLLKESEDEYKQKISDKDKLTKDLEKAKEELKEAEKKKNHESDFKSRMETEKSVYEKCIIDLEYNKENLKKAIEDKENMLKQLKEIEKAKLEASKLESNQGRNKILSFFKESADNLKSLKKEESMVMKKIEDVKKYKEILNKEKPFFEKHTSLENEIKLLESKKSKIEDKLTEFNNIEKSKKEIDELVDKSKKEMENFFKEANETLSCESSDLNELGNYINKIKSAGIVKEKSINNDIISKKENISALNEGIRQNKKQLDELNLVENQCPLCLSDIDTTKRDNLIDSCKNNIESNNNKIELLNKEINAFEKEKTELDNLLDKIQSIENRIPVNSKILEDILVNIKKSEDLDKQIQSNTATNDLKEIIPKLKELTEEYNKTKINYNNYIESQGSIKVLGDERDVQREFDKIIRKINSEIDKIKRYSDRDEFLRGKFTEEEFKEELERVRQAESKYYQLTGVIKGERKLIIDIRAKDIDMRDI
ncbi:MAG: AAA family ATPase, partial [Methanobacteriaceae archaeon]